MALRVEENERFAERSQGLPAGTRLIPTGSELSIRFQIDWGARATTGRITARVSGANEVDELSLLQSRISDRLRRRIGGADRNPGDAITRFESDGFYFIDGDLVSMEDRVTLAGELNQFLGDVTSVIEEVEPEIQQRVETFNNTNGLEIELVHRPTNLILHLGSRADGVDRLMQQFGLTPSAFLPYGEVVQLGVDAGDIEDATFGISLSAQTPLRTTLESILGSVAPQ